MNNYVLLKTGEIFVLVGEDNQKEIYKISPLGGYLDIEEEVLTVKHSQVYLIDSNLALIQMYSRKLYEDKLTEQACKV